MEPFLLTCRLAKHSRKSLAPFVNRECMADDIDVGIMARVMEGLETVKLSDVVPNAPSAVFSRVIDGHY